MTICSICNAHFEGRGNNPRPLLTAADRCCDACDSTVVGPLRVARIVAFEGANRVAEFALMLARQRFKVAPSPATRVKDTALIAATGMVANAVEALHAEGVNPHAR